MVASGFHLDGGTEHSIYGITDLRSEDPELKCIISEIGHKRPECQW